MPQKRVLLKRARKSAGLTQEELAYRLGVDRSTVVRWEAGTNEPSAWMQPRLAKLLGVSRAELDSMLNEPNVVPRSEMQQALDTALEQATEAQRDRFDTLLPGVRIEDSGEAARNHSGWCMTSSKYVPIYIGAEAAAELANDPRLVERNYEWISGKAIAAPYPRGTCGLTVFDFGVVVAEIVEEVSFTSVAEFAAWRKASYATAHERVGELVRSHWPTITNKPSYVLSTYRITQPWPQSALHIAMRLICSPSVLLERHEPQTAEQSIIKGKVAEQRCYSEGFYRADIESFGIDGVAIGYASWSGVSYLPLSPERAITRDEMSSFEMVTQALWCYTNMIAESIESGHDPVVPTEFGWRFLRACYSHLTTARPMETGQHRMMKDAILTSSRLATQLIAAQAILRDATPLAGRR